MERSPRRRRFLALAGALVTGLAGCGGDDGSTTDSPTGSPTEGSPSTRTPTDTAPSPATDTRTATPGHAGDATVSGTLARFHRVTLDFEGPETAESADPNPFLRFRLRVRFEHAESGASYDVPGFFAADGNAADSGATAGSTWRVRFTPGRTGEWSYEASFRSGTDVAVSLADDAGVPAGFDGAGGTFTVGDSGASDRDFRAPDRGFVRNDGGHYFTLSGSGDVWIKGGPNIPENLLGFAGFDDTPDRGTGGNHEYAAHVDDWAEGDPTWDGGRGKGIVGALNYVAERGANCVYFLPNNLGGDGEETFPHTDPDARTRYDVSKLAQWETVFQHATSKGVFLHFQLAETEAGNENYYDGGSLGPERKLFYRELHARFGHHPASEWNVGEENDYGTEKREAFAARLKAIDPYDHPVTTHTHIGQIDSFYEPLLGNADFDVTSFQTTDGGTGLAETIGEWRDRSADAGVPWVVSADETQTVTVDDLDPGRREKMWPTYMGGGGGYEWYIRAAGGGHSLDQEIDDLGRIEPALNWAGNAVSLLERLPVREMAPAHDLGSAETGTTYVLANPGSSYLLYNDERVDSLSLDLSDAGGTFSVSWYDPREGGALTAGSVDTVSGGAERSLGTPPGDAGSDWLAVVR